MKIVIDIPEKAYEAFKEWHKNKVATVEQSIIANGTPLPKGHGRLKDADYIKLFSIDHDSWNGVEYEGVIKVVPVIAIDNASTIIEADKEAENE
jgi:hypothetical protein